MHYFVAEISRLETGSVVGFLKHAEAIYNENLAAYVRIVLRRPFAKLFVWDVMGLCGRELISIYRNSSRAWRGCSKRLHRAKFKRMAIIINRH